MQRILRIFILGLGIVSLSPVESAPNPPPNPIERRKSAERLLKNRYLKHMQSAVNACGARSGQCLQRPRTLRVAYHNPHDRSPAFANFTNASAPGGVCWGYALVQRRLLAMARFNASGSPAPRKRSEARRLLLPVSWGVPATLPGVRSVDELSRHAVYGPELKKIMTENWATEFYNPANLSWALRLRSPAENRQELGRVAVSRARQEVPLLVLQFTVSRQHVVLVERITRDRYGYKLHIVDSNIPGVSQNIYFDNGGNYRAEKSRTLYRGVSAMGLKVVDENHSGRDYLGLASECCGFTR